MSTKWNSWIEKNENFDALHEEFARLITDYKDKFAEYNLEEGYYLKPDANGKITIYRFAPEEIEVGKKEVLIEMLMQVKNGEGYKV